MSPNTLLVFCPSCKKVLLDDGSWESAPTYYEKQLIKTPFSHEFCPGCVPDPFDELFPGIHIKD